MLIGECLNIIQHPNGELKQVALRENQLKDILPQFLHYHTDTAPGSSGSPVFNDQWELVALHHSGVPRTDGQGRYLTRDGAVWEPSMGEQRIDWIANEGARVSQIVAAPQESELSGDAKKLRAAFLDGGREPRRPEPCTPPPEQPTKLADAPRIAARMALLHGRSQSRSAFGSADQAASVPAADAPHYPAAVRSQSDAARDLPGTGQRRPPSRLRCRRSGQGREVLRRSGGRSRPKTLLRRHRHVGTPRPLCSRRCRSC